MWKIKVIWVIILSNVFVSTQIALLPHHGQLHLSRQAQVLYRGLGTSGSSILSCSCIYMDGSIGAEGVRFGGIPSLLFADADGRLL